MTDEAKQSRNRYFLLVVIRLIATAGAVFGVILAAKYPHWQMKVLGGAILLSGLYMGYTVPAALAHRWATPGNVRTNRRRPPKPGK